MTHVSLAIAFRIVALSRPGSRWYACYDEMALIKLLVISCLLRPF